MESTETAIEEVSEEKVEISPEEKEKQDYARNMRLLLSPKEMLHPDGNLNRDYFKVTVKYQKVRKWGENEKKLLADGINKHGIGNWVPIVNEYLPEWRNDELRIKTSIMMGRQSLALYKDWKGDAEAIAQERERNYKIGMETGCWKGHYLVNDEAGEVARLIQETEKRGEKRKSEQQQ